MKNENWNQLAKSIIRWKMQQYEVRVAAQDESVLSEIEEDVVGKARGIWMLVRQMRGLPVEMSDWLAACGR